MIVSSTKKTWIFWICQIHDNLKQMIYTLIDKILITSHSQAWNFIEKKD